MLIGCAPSTERAEVADSNDTAVAAQQISIAQRVSVEEFNKLISQPEIQLVDVRTPGEYEAGAIGNAINIDYMGDDFVKVSEGQLDKQKPVVVYCAAGGRSAKAMDALKKAGFKEVYELGVGYNGYPK